MTEDRILLDMLKENEEAATKLKLGDLDGIEEVLENLDWKVDMLGFTEEQQRFFNIQNKLLRALTAYLNLQRTKEAIIKALTRPDYT